MNSQPMHSRRAPGMLRLSAAMKLNRVLFRPPVLIPPWPGLAPAGRAHPGERALPGFDDNLAGGAGFVATRAVGSFLSGKF